MYKKKLIINFWCERVGFFTFLSGLFGKKKNLSYRISYGKIKLMFGGGFGMPLDDVVDLNDKERLARELATLKRRAEEFGYSWKINDDERFEKLKAEIQRLNDAEKYGGGGV